jgi:hypothetical protein
MRRVEGILYAATQEEGHRIMQDAQRELAGAVYDGELLEGSEAAEGGELAVA